MDRARIVYVSQLSGAEHLVETALNEQPPLTVSTLAYRFGVAEMLESDKSTEFLIANAKRGGKVVLQLAEGVTQGSGELFGQLRYRIGI